MRRTLFAAILFVFFAQFAFGHPPDSISVDFDNNTKLMSVIVHHPVKPGTTKEHYIKEINVKLNSKKMILQNPTEQETEKGISVIFRIPQGKVGDKIDVTGVCSKFGDKTQSITVQPKVAAKPPEPISVPKKPEAQTK